MELEGNDRTARSMTPARSHRGPILQNRKHGKRVRGGRRQVRSLRSCLLQTRKPHTKRTVGVDSSAARIPFPRVASARAVEAKASFWSAVSCCCSNSGETPHPADSFVSALFDGDDAFDDASWRHRWKSSARRPPATNPGIQAVYLWVDDDILCGKSRPPIARDSRI